MNLTEPLHEAQQTVQKHQYIHLNLETFTACDDLYFAAPSTQTLYKFLMSPPINYSDLSSKWR